ncbi:hypothetical protein MPSEU_000059900 [Mayamaea pseudoterrestris]|nr:hypothetical protein MPSEU_000059900 [Mayamaea pseudoterrestris]
MASRSRMLLLSWSLPIILSTIKCASAAPRGATASFRRVMERRRHHRQLQMQMNDMTNEPTYIIFTTEPTIAPTYIINDDDDDFVTVTAQPTIAAAVPAPVATPEPTRKPTPRPSDLPTTRQPVTDPPTSKAPTTSEPTVSAVTLEPTQEPTLEPTFTPTKSPTTKRPATLPPTILFLDDDAPTPAQMDDTETPTTKPNKKTNTKVPAPTGTDATETPTLGISTIVALSKFPTISPEARTVNAAQSSSARPTSIVSFAATFIMGLVVILVR